MTSPRSGNRSPVTLAFGHFAGSGVAPGVLLLLCTLAALVWANSPWSSAYFHLWESELSIGFAGNRAGGSLHRWINDGLMAVFFLRVGLEIKRELLVGELSQPGQAVLPIAAALGGMILPALLFFAVNRGGPGAAGWGIPMATDIAFALGILALLGSRVPAGLKVFLTGLAIVDDIGAVVVIALFYTQAIQWSAILMAVGATGLLVLLNRWSIQSLVPYSVAGAILWMALHSSGVHATVAGVILALAIPSSTWINAVEYSRRTRDLLDGFDRSETGDLLVLTSRGQQDAIHEIEVTSSRAVAPLLRLEHSLHGTVNYLIVPIFALANAGVELSAARQAVSSPVAIGVVLGLLLGKPLGVMLFSVLAVRFGLARLPGGVSWPQVHGVAWLAGIGFTMSLFIGELAFRGGEMMVAARLGILGASAVAGVAGSLLVSGATQTRRKGEGMVRNGF